MRGPLIRSWTPTPARKRVDVRSKMRSSSSRTTMAALAQRVWRQRSCSGVSASRTIVRVGSTFLFVWFSLSLLLSFSLVLEPFAWPKSPRAIRGPVLSARLIRIAGASRPRPTEGGTSGTMLAIPTLLKPRARTSQSGDPIQNDSANKKSRTTRRRTGSDSICPSRPTRSVRNRPRRQSRRPIKVSPGSIHSVKLRGPAQVNVLAGFEFYKRIQSNDGHWAGEYGGPSRFRSSVLRSRPHTDWILIT